MILRDEIACVVNTGVDEMTYCNILVCSMVLLLVVLLAALFKSKR